MAGYILIDLEITDPEGFKVAKNRAIVVQGLMNLTTESGNCTIGTLGTQAS